VNRHSIFLLPLTGELPDATAFVNRVYPGSECIFLSKRELREAGWRGQARALRRARGEAFIFFLRSMSDLQEPQLTIWSTLLHRCRRTVLADASGNMIVYGALDYLRLLPGAITSGLSDIFVFAAAWILLRLFRHQAAPVQVSPAHNVDMDLAYLYPFPLDTAVAGGALSHVRGFLSGVAAQNGTCEIFSGRKLPGQNSSVHVVRPRRRFFLFRESLMLSYNLQFVRQTRAQLRRRVVGSLYQRHGRFLIVGALLSARMKVPLILEYNGSELWIANHWDSARFSRWLKICEDVSIQRAHHIVVVSQPLKQELMERGIPEERIILNPNGVDPCIFRPGGGDAVRSEVGFARTDVVAGFVGTFDRWHGMPVLASAIKRLLEDKDARLSSGSLRFLLIGDGVLRAETEKDLHRYSGNEVIFTGLVPHDQVAAYLDATDILLSPHVPMPDGRPFFGSPTKLFEYMAMAKGIVASNLDQLSEVLQHGTSAWLVEPGNVPELSAAILLLARDCDLRQRLGQNARASVLAHYTWKQNAQRVLLTIRGSHASRNTEVSHMPRVS
jgi:glycosyltransferase involved in cell wall biosynthesis